MQPWIVLRYATINGDSMQNLKVDFPKNESNGADHGEADDVPGCSNA
jgi:hypothetical protein